MIRAGSNSGRKAAIVGVVAVVAMLGGRFVLPAIASDTAAAANLIDKDFQNAIRKHIERRFFNFIGASDSQKDQIDKLISAQMDQSYPLREQLREGLVDLNQLCAKDDASDDQITEKAHQLRALHETIMDQRLATLLKVRQTLSPDQRKLVADRINDLLTGDAKPGLMHRLQSALPAGRFARLF